MNRDGEATDHEPIVVEQSFHCSIDQLWKAITEQQQMINWFFEDIPEFSAKVGFETRFRVDTGERQFTHLWKILEVVPNKKIVYDWRYLEYEGSGIVHFELSESASSVMLRVTNKGIESFTAEIAEFSRSSCEAGWSYFLQDSLKNYLEAKILMGNA